VALKRVSFILVDVQSDVLSPSRMHTTAFSIDQQLCWRHLWYASQCINASSHQCRVILSQLFKTK